MKNRHDVSMEGCVAKGLGLTGVRDTGELSSLASAQDVAAQTAHGQVVRLPLGRASMCHQAGAFSTGPAQSRWQEMLAE